MGRGANLSEAKGRPEPFKNKCKGLEIRNKGQAARASRPLNPHKIKFYAPRSK